MRLAIDFEAEVADPVITGLDVTAFQHGDLVNLILQRSEVLWDFNKPGAIIRSWNNGDMAPINAAVDRLGEDIARRAAAVIHAEFRSLAPVLSQITMARIADIGCGYAFFDLFAAKEYGCEVVLIDLEQNERRHFGFQSDGAAYTSLDVARKMMVRNGISDQSIRALNPGKDDLTTCSDIDLAVSFLSCGFHYPVDSYISFFENSVGKNGSVILDLRAGKSGEQLVALAGIGSISYLSAPPKAKRAFLRKSEAA